MVCLHPQQHTGIQTGWINADFSSRYAENSILIKGSMVPHIGPLATRNCEPRQARKGAAAAVASCAGVWLVWVTTHSLFRYSYKWFRYCVDQGPDAIITPPATLSLN